MTMISQTGVSLGFEERYTGKNRGLMGLNDILMG